LGASFLEKHLTYDKTASGPDHPYALDVPEFTAMVTQIRQLEAALGSGIKQPVAAEIPERIGARRAVYAKRPISKGEHISADMIKIVRHAYPEGIGADDADRVIGRTAADDIDEDSLLTWETLLP
jgi:sialic acid synthase SpsE